MKEEPMKKIIERLSREGRYDPAQKSWTFNRALTNREALACLGLPRP